MVEGWYSRHEAAAVDGRHDALRSANPQETPRSGQPTAPRRTSAAQEEGREYDLRGWRRRQTCVRVVHRLDLGPSVCRAADASQCFTRRNSQTREN